MGGAKGRQVVQRWVILGGSDESPALAADRDVERYVVGFASKSTPQSCCVLWLGEMSRELARQLPSVTRFEAAASAEDPGAEVRAWYAGADAVKLLLCAPLRFHRQKWWASGAREGIPHHFDLQELLQALRPVRAAYDVLVPSTRAWHCPSATTVDVPDASTLRSWQSDTGVNACRLIDLPGGHVPHRPALEEFGKTLSAPLLSPLDELLDGFSSMEEMAGGDTSPPIYLHGVDADPSGWRELLSGCLEALRLEARVLKPSETPKRALICVLEDEALSHQLALQQALHAWRDSGAGLLLLDRATHPGNDPVRRWRMDKPQWRGAWRPFHQALWLSQRFAASRKTGVPVDMDLLRADIGRAHRELRAQTGHLLNDALGSMADELRDLRERSGYKPEIQERLEWFFSLVDGRNRLCLAPGGTRGVRPALGTLLAACDALKNSPDRPPLSVPRSRLRPVLVRLTYSGNEAFSDKFPILATARYLKLIPPTAIVDGRCDIITCDVWLHAAESSTGRLSLETTDGAAAQKIQVFEEDCDAGPSSYTDAVLALQDSLHEWLRDHSVFISYTSPDRSFAIALMNTLEAQGVRCWIDIRDANGGYVKEALKSAIDRSRVVLVILSDEAVRRLWVLEEIEMALRVQDERRYPVLTAITLDGQKPWQHCQQLYEIPPQREILVHAFEREMNGPRFQEAVQDLVESLIDTAKLRPRPTWVLPEPPDPEA